MIAQFLCGGCNVREPWEHRCHSNHGQVCLCDDCLGRRCRCQECREAEAPVSEGLFPAATQRRDVSRFRVCRGVLQVLVPRCQATRVRDISWVQAATDRTTRRPLRLALKMSVQVVNGILLFADAVTAEVTILIERVSPTFHLKPPCSGTVT